MLRAPSEVLLCQTWPQTDCEFDVKNILPPGELPLQTLKCQIESVREIQNHVYLVRLLLPAGKLPEFYAGQYLALHYPDKQSPSYYSIASKPGGRHIELHIQANPKMQSATDVISHLKQVFSKKALIELSLPYGKACLMDVPEQELILICAGTGFAQMTSIIEFLFANAYKYDVSLYWGVRQAQDMYMLERAKSWEASYHNFHFCPVIAPLDAIADNAHHNQLSDAVLAKRHHLENAKVFVSGSPKLVFSAMDALVEAGLSEHNFYSDVLEYVQKEA